MKATALALVVLLGPAALVPPLGASEPAEASAEAFIETALRGIGARETACPGELLQEIESRSLKARCAFFDGSFTTFRDRWAEWTEAAVPQTGWSVSGIGLNYDRVYAFGGRALGVRFTRGEILIVFSL